MKNQLAAALHVTAPYARKFGPWMTLAVSGILITNDLKKH
jgi:hypothetical protein